MQGVAALPQHCMSLCAGFFAAAIAISALRDVLPERYARFVPIPMAAAIPFYIGANLAVRDAFLPVVIDPLLPPFKVTAKTCNFRGFAGNTQG